MRTRTPPLVLMAGAVLALAPAVEAATPFTAGTGNGHDVAVGSDGKGHVVWLEEGSPDRVHYCRVPAGATACEIERFLTFPGISPNADSLSPHVQVFAPAPFKVVVLAHCTQCPDGASDHKTFRFIAAAPSNGDVFGTGVQ